MVLAVDGREVEILSLDVQGAGNLDHSGGSILATYQSGEICGGCCFSSDALKDLLDRSLKCGVRSKLDENIRWSMFSPFQHQRTRCGGEQHGTNKVADPVRSINGAKLDQPSV